MQAGAGPPGSSDSLGSHGGHGLQAPIARSSEAVFVAAQVQGLQPRAHGAKGGEGGEGTVLQGRGRPGGGGWRSCGQSTVGSWGSDPVALLRSDHLKKDR